jgi:transposase
LSLSVQQGRVAVLILPTDSRADWLGERARVARAALAARAHWLTVEWLPKYTPELNDIEVVWHDLKGYNLAHQTFTGVAELDEAIHKAVEDLNRERAVVPLAKPQISA